MGTATTYRGRILCFCALAAMGAAQDKLAYKHLPAYLADVKAALPLKGSNGFHEPSAAERTRFTECMGFVFAGEVERAQTCLRSVHYDLGLLEDTPFHAEYLVVSEHPGNSKGLGTYIVNNEYWRNVVLEVPHPLFDAGTLEESIEVFQKTGLRALFVAGTHRCANLGEAGCSGTTDACGKPAMPYRASDAAHFDRNFFTAAHQAVLRLASQPVAISVHGNGEEPVDAELSDGTRVPAPPDALILRLRNALKAQGVRTGSCNSPADFPGNFTLCGESNVQGRLTNGSKSCCKENAHKPAGMFVHIEQRRAMRENPMFLITAVRKVFSADGPGAPRSGGHSGRE